MHNLHKINSIRFEKTVMIVNVDDKIYRINLTDVSLKLAKAPDKMRNEYIVSPSGYGIHWPLLDEDLSVEGIIQHAIKSKELIN